MYRLSTTQIIGVLAMVALVIGLTKPTLGAPPENKPSRLGKNLPSDSRFTVLTELNNEAVRDNNTGLVWERSPDTTPHTWDVSRGHCAELEVEGRKGWSLPTQEQLATLVDPSNRKPALPMDHPFQNVQLAFYWSATTLADAPTLAWVVEFGRGKVMFNDKNAFSFYAWCVR